MSKSALGRGLGALLGGVSPAPKAATPASTPTGSVPAATGTVSAADHIQRVAIGRVVASALQPRQDFPPAALQELADSIREQGILQPLIVRARGQNFELIAGERRWRAAQQLGLAEVPIVVRAADDHSALEIMLIENLQRENLNPIEEAQGYRQLMTQFQLSQEEVAAKVGRNRASVANSLRLLKLAAEVQDWLRHGQLSAGHAKAILALATPEQQVAAARKVIEEGASVRATEEFVVRWQKRGQPVGLPGQAGGEPAPRDAHVTDLENRLQQRLGTKVRLRYRKGRGAVTIHFFNDDELDRILQIISVKVD